MVLESSDPRRQLYFPHIQDDVAVSLPTLDKYDLDLFFLAPFYPSFFPNLRKLIVVDLDVEFRYLEDISRTDCLTPAQGGSGGAGPAVQPAG